jgi:hypothetical protein
LKWTKIVLRNSLVRTSRKCTSHKIKTLLILKSRRFTLKIENFGIISNILFKIWFNTLVEWLRLVVEWFLIFYHKYRYRYFSFGKPVYFNDYFGQFTGNIGYWFTGIAILKSYYLQKENLLIWKLKKWKIVKNMAEKCKFLTFFRYFQFLYFSKKIFFFLQIVCFYSSEAKYK